MIHLLHSRCFNSFQFNPLRQPFLCLLLPVSVLCFCTDFTIPSHTPSSPLAKKVTTTRYDNPLILASSLFCPASTKPNPGAAPTIHISTAGLWHSSLANCNGHDNNHTHEVSHVYPSCYCISEQGTMFLSLRTIL
jgi:hypothetical protein